MASLSTKQTEGIFLGGGGGGGVEGKGVLRWHKTFPPPLGHVVY